MDMEVCHWRSALALALPQSAMFAAGTLDVVRHRHPELIICMVGLQFRMQRPCRGLLLGRSSTSASKRASLNVGTRPKIPMP